MNKIPPDSPVGNYLLARGIDLGFASGKTFMGNQGSDSKIELVKERFEAAEYLGIKEEQLKWDLDSELLCFPLYPWGWLTKRFPESMSGSGKGFRATLGLKGATSDFHSRIDVGSASGRYKTSLYHRRTS